MSVSYVACPPHTHLFFGNINFEIFKLFIKNWENAVRASLVLLRYDRCRNLWTIIPTSHLISLLLMNNSFHCHQHSRCWHADYMIPILCLKDLISPPLPTKWSSNSLAWYIIKFVHDLTPIHSTASFSSTPQVSLCIPGCKYILSSVIIANALPSTLCWLTYLILKKLFEVNTIILIL